ncbi:MAG TPA: hypothetical protein IAA29_12080 [Candidatus Paenibacillus intestinavium]|nr:hypothetical protein [Candidatus Paenibacillus intestinavium]
MNKLIDCKEMDLFLADKELEVTELKEGRTVTFDLGEVSFTTIGPATVVVIKQKTPSEQIQLQKELIEQGSHKLCGQCLNLVQMTHNFCGKCGISNPK